MFKVVEVKNCRWANAGHTLLDCDVNFSHLPEEFVPFTAMASGDTDYSHEIFAKALAGEYGVIAEYAAPPAPTTEELAFMARSDRDRALTSTDWTQLPDTPQATKELWQPFRQALRDITAQTGFPNNIVWPTPPQ